MSSDIYGMQEPPVSSRRKRAAVSQRRDEYLRTRGEKSAPRHQRHSRRHHHQSFGRKAVLFVLGVMALLTALGIIGAVLLSMHRPVEGGIFPKNGILPKKTIEK